MVYSTTDIWAIVICGVIAVVALVCLRFENTYIADRSKRYIHPPKQAEQTKRKEVKR